MTMTFLEMVRARHRMRNDPKVDPVPWELDDKLRATEYVASRGYLVPRSIRCNTIEDALQTAKSEFGKRFVLKPSGLHSGIGVHMLDEVAPGVYFEARRLALLTDREIVAPSGQWSGAIAYWLAEEWVPSNTAGHPIPPDYRVYAFDGQVTHIAHSDYNVSPPYRSIFDGAWIPLRPGVDFQCNFNLRASNPVFPRHAEAILAMAQELSADLGTRFVRVDLYDGPDGPVFGEFSFFPGSDDTGEVTYSPRVLDLLDRATNGERVAALSGYDIDMEGWRAEVSRTGGPTFAADFDVYSRLAVAGLGGHMRHFGAMRSLLRDGPTRGVLGLALAVGAEVSGNAERAFDISHALRSRAPFIRSARLVAESDCRAIRYADERADGNAWWRARSAELRLAGGDESAIATLQELAREGMGHAIRVLQARGVEVEPAPGGEAAAGRL